ncbi:hypothetical protein [Woeseia oceani]|uniref:Uncharacterized protein n=1 Tax=Woeseia oceani TaxID=1548547 RepID=A0A193LI10_9GAMM|nr:hypothetical protein [Woeseia oceani]ANO52024.1 hypothetical protein BA177_13180 [Woeseia oceani]
MDWTLVYGFLIAMGLFVAVWFVFVVPSERRDHARKLEIVQKRIAEREQRQQAAGDTSSDTTLSRSSDP